MQIPYLDLVLPPKTEPLTLAEAKLALRVDGSDEDAYIISLIKTARTGAEEYLRSSLITQEWQLQYDQYAPNIIILPKSPVQDIKTVKIINQDWSEKLMLETTYHFDRSSSQLIFQAAPIGLIIQVRYTAGYGEAVDIPPAIIQGLLHHIVSMHENRDNFALPATTVELYAPFKKVGK